LTVVDAAAALCTAAAAAAQATILVVGDRTVVTFRSPCVDDFHRDSLQAHLKAGKPSPFASDESEVKPAGCVCGGGWGGERGKEYDGGRGGRRGCLVAVCALYAAEKRVVHATLESSTSPHLSLLRSLFFLRAGLPLWVSAEAGACS
jgi:hypothetical protein